MRLNIGREWFQKHVTADDVGVTAGPGTRRVTPRLLQNFISRLNALLPPCIRVQDPDADPPGDSLAPRPLPRLVGVYTQEGGTRYACCVPVEAMLLGRDGPEFVADYLCHAFGCARPETPR